eukprot:TRINITY_DN22033_c0_g1_i1.p1 TRINITY_DN22033_c0_g1~~TRINITY_DN22033_c0_g1_i1.p1  ORF type:complete len:424 (-),score=81.81 TRINITY_DN22033_c0_g1_i1:54-1292(-)
MASRAPPRLLTNVGLLILCLAAAAVTVSWAAIEGQCHVDENGIEKCNNAQAAKTENIEGTSVPAAPSPSSGDNELMSDSGSFAQNGTAKALRKKVPLPWERLAILLFFAMLMLIWIIATVKWAIDGSLPARLALWGFLPEAYAAISVRAVAALLRLKSHETPVILLANCVTDKNAHELAEAFSLYGKKADLQALELPRNRGLGHEGIRKIIDAILEEGLNFQELDLSMNPHLGPRLMTTLQPLFEYPSSKLNTLRLQDCGLQADTLKPLAMKASKLRLTVLDLSGNPLAGAGEVLSEIMEAPILEELALACCGLEIEDVKAVAEQLPYTSIRTLALAANGIGAEGLKALSEALPESQIDELGLEGNELEVKDLPILGAAWAKRQFSRLKLMGNPIEQKDIIEFVQTLKSMAV